MTKVYVVLYLLGKIVADIGPWPGETLDAALKSCQSNEPESNRNIDKVFADPEKLKGMRKENPGLERKDVYWKCITSDTRPFIPDAVPMEHKE